MEKGKSSNFCLVTNREVCLSGYIRGLDGAWHVTAKYQIRDSVKSRALWRAQCCREHGERSVLKRLAGQEERTTRHWPTWTQGGMKYVLSRGITSMLLETEQLTLTGRKK